MYTNLMVMLAVTGCLVTASYALYDRLITVLEK